MDAANKTCLITGSRGYLGAELSAYLRREYWNVIDASRLPEKSGDVPYSLEIGLPGGSFKGVDALVHCAYDFSFSDWKNIRRRNVEGTKLLLNQARAAGVKNIITISSVSAYPGCHSFYGKAKLLIEEATSAVGGTSLRPGLIYGGSNRGMYGRLAKQAGTKRLLPLLTGSSCIQYLIHIQDLCHVIAGILSGTIVKPSTAWIVAHPQPWPLRQLLSVLAGKRGITFIPVPWQAVWLALRAAELVGFRLTFKSDSVRSIAYYNRQPDFTGFASSGVTLRDFNAEQ